MTFVKRPLGITILAVLNFIGAAFEAVLFILAVAAPETLLSWISALSPQGSGPDELSISDLCWLSISPLWQ